MTSSKPNERARETTGTKGVYYRLSTKRGQRNRKLYEIAYRDAAGRQRRERVHGDIDAARALLRERQRAVEQARGRRQRGEPDNPDRTLRELADEWRRLYLDGLRASTRSTYLGSLENYVLPAFGDERVRDIDARAVRYWLAALRRGDHSAGRPLSANTIRAALTPLRNVLSHAVDEELIGANPVDSLRRRHRPQSDKREVRVLDDAELGALDRAAAAHRLALRVLALTGLRVAELRGLAWADIDLEAATLRVRWQADKAGRRVEPKTEAARRTVSLPAFLVKALREHYLAIGRPGADAPVFMGRPGEPVTYGMLSSAFGQAVRRAGLGASPGKRLSLHALRHGYGSMLIAQGHDVAYVSRALGHAKPSITLDIYTHEFGARDVESGRRVADDLEARFGSQGGSQ